MSIHLNPHAIRWPDQATWIHALVITPDSKTLIGACMDRKIYIWDIETREIVRAPLEGHNNSIRCLAISQMADIAYSGADEGDIRIWRLGDDAKCDGVWRNAHQGAVRCVALSKDGRRCASGGDDGAVCLWDTATGEMLGEPGRRHQHPISCITFSDSGDHIASGDEGGVLAVWQTGMGELKFRDFILGPKALTGAVGIPGKEEILTSCADTTILHWALAQKAKIGEPWKGHTDEVRCIGLFNNAEEAVTGGRDSIVRLWDIASGVPLGAPWVSQEMPVETLAVAPNSSLVITAGANEMWTWTWEIEIRPDPEGEELTEEEAQLRDAQLKALEKFKSKRPAQEIVYIDEPIPFKQQDTPVKASDTKPSKAVAEEVKVKKQEQIALQPKPEPPPPPPEPEPPPPTPEPTPAKQAPPQVEEEPPKKPPLSKEILKEKLDKKKKEPKPEPTPKPAPKKNEKPKPTARKAATKPSTPRSQTRANRDKSKQILAAAVTGMAVFSLGLYVLYWALESAASTPKPSPPLPATTTTHDPAEAEQLHQRALDYFHGRGCKQNVHEAIILFIDAAERGSEESCKMLAYIYENGLGVIADAQRAQYWLNRAEEARSEQLPTIEVGEPTKPPPLNEETHHH